MNGIRSALVDAVIAALPVAIVFFSGWAYLSSYLGEFGVDATEVTIPLPTVLVYAFSPLKSPRVLFFLGISLAAWLVSEGYGEKTACRNQITLVTSLVGLVIFLFVVRDAAQAEARTMAKFVWEGDKALSVPVLVSPHEGEAYAAFEQCRDRRGLRQILGLPDRMYVFCRDKYYPCQRGRMFVVSTSGSIIYSALKFNEREPGEKECEK
ncbi:hypothetical protein EOD23_05955 [Mesorhizobium sp. USDA-HM6]|nr:hypothetical protein EOD23_05955 [Mesorhizobium sp. USDA-HM6]